MGCLTAQHPHTAATEKSKSSQSGASTVLPDIKALAVTDWLKGLPLSPKTRGQVRALLHLIFERAMLWELIEVQRNPIELAKVKGSSRRLKKTQTITPENFRNWLLS